MVEPIDIICEYQRSRNKYLCYLGKKRHYSRSTRFDQMSVINNTRVDHLHVYTPDNFTVYLKEVYCYIYRRDKERGLTCSDDLYNIVLSEEDDIGVGYPIKERLGYTKEDKQRIMALREL